MDSNRILKLLLAIFLVLVAGFFLWMMQQPSRDAWNYAVASRIADHYNNDGVLPKNKDELLVRLGNTEVNRGFLSALGEMKFRGISESDFFSGGGANRTSEQSRKTKISE